MTFETPVSTLPFVGPKYQQLLANLGITSIADLLYHLPSRYVDLSTITPIEELIDDELQVVKARVESIKKVRLKGGGRLMVTAQATDETGSMQLTWFNQPYIEQSLVVDQKYRFAGEVEYKFGKHQMISPTFELASKPMVHTGRIVPIYHLTAGISSKWLRARISPLLSKLDSIAVEFLPRELIDQYKLLRLPQALSQIHRPDTMDLVNLARRRLAFDEMLLLQLASLQRKAALQRGPTAMPMAIEPSQLADWTTKLPFALTQAQRRVTDEILADMGRQYPMNRLLEGDVGSGKTVVAALAATTAIVNGYQVAIMAPTSILAQQHYQTFQKLLTLFETGQKTAISFRTAKSKQEPAQITIGTHALIAESVEFDNLGLVIIDEQHRFGVVQRAKLLNKSQAGVHTLSMSATPIPRTLALTAYGDLDISVIDQMPADRLPVKTHVVPQAKRDDMEGFLASAMARGEQIYIICPLIDESDTLTEVRAATAEFERLQKRFPQYQLALLHGRLKANQKETILDQFKAHLFDCLVSTAVVEVGIDVPNATMLVVEGAERFGLAQLHQLRGRVGRGTIQSYCFLLSDAAKVEEIARLKHLEKEHNGMVLAELDLAMRGPGEVYGQRQSGIPQLKAASFSDVELIKITKDAAEWIMTQQLLAQNDRLATQLSRAQRAVAMN